MTGSYARSGLPAALTSATYDDANQIATFGGTTFSYDANGNLTNDGVRSYTWNARNQLASLTGPVSGSFAYDGVGRRRSKTIGSTTTGFLYDGLNPVQELSGGTPTANLLTGSVSTNSSRAPVGAVEMSRAIIDRLAEILVRHDPIQLYLAEHANEDEYMPEAVDIAEVLGSCTSRESCLELIYLCFVRNFGASIAGNPDRYAAVAAEIWELRKRL